MKSKDLILQLKKSGCSFVRHGKGDHQIWYSPITRKKFVVPHPKKNLPPGTLRSIKRVAGL
ncbi:MAG: type II toxin-antitoxin system HicA family toxin [Idiomarina sp.]|nr:type II toxin-antitoxin system HicA family toxin [Idiomarina sp.]